jgi:hypothetical protein
VVRRLLVEVEVAVRKLEKGGKTMRKSRERAPADQQLMDTQCDFCKKQYPDPTTARIHMDEVHPGAYSA